MDENYVLTILLALGAGLFFVISLYIGKEKEEREKEARLREGRKEQAKFRKERKKEARLREIREKEEERQMLEREEEARIGRLEREEEARIGRRIREQRKLRFLERKRKRDAENELVDNLKSLIHERDEDIIAPYDGSGASEVEFYNPLLRDAENFAIPKLEAGMTPEDIKNEFLKLLTPEGREKELRRLRAEQPDRKELNWERQQIKVEKIKEEEEKLARESEKAEAEIAPVIDEVNQLIEVAASLNYPNNLASLDSGYFKLVPLSLYCQNTECPDFKDLGVACENHVVVWEKMEETLGNMLIGYERAINVGILDPKVKANVHYLIVLISSNMGSYIRSVGGYIKTVDQPLSALFTDTINDSEKFSVLDSSFYHSTLDKPIRGLFLNNAHNARYHIGESEQILESCYKRDPSDNEVIGLLAQIHNFLNRNNKTSREVAYIWRQIENDNLPESPLLAQKSEPTSTVAQGIRFEQRCMTLLEAMNWAVTTTKTSGDGGIDLVAVDRTPITGGEMIIQCKDWSSPVGVSVIRDLFGQVSAERKNKGIVITSGRFTKESEDFAVDKNIELIDGDTLGQLEREFLGS